MTLERKETPVEYDPRRVFGMQAADWMERVNFDRLRKERLAKIKKLMKQKGIDAMLLTMEDNIRYATGRWGGGWMRPGYALITLKGDPVLFETVGEDTKFVQMNCPWLPKVKPAITYGPSGAAFDWMLGRYVDQIKSTLKEEGADLRGKMGVDTMDFVTYKAFTNARVNIVYGGEVIYGARWVKTKDELELLKIACSIADAGFEMAYYKYCKPGVRECEAAGKVMDYAISVGAGRGSVALLSGANTNPYNRVNPSTDKIIRRGDMILIDMCIANVMGYGSDYVRCWVCEATPTQEQKEIYKECYRTTYSAINAVKAGVSTADIAKHFSQYDDDKYETASLEQFGHSWGLWGYEGFWISRGFSFKYPMKIQKNMYLAIETYEGRPGSSHGARLEENLVVTEDGYQAFSLFPFEENLLEGFRVGKEKTNTH